MATPDPIEQQLLFSDVFTAEDMCLAGDLDELLSPDFIKEFLSDGDDLAAFSAPMHKVSTSGEVVSNFDRAGSPEVSSACPPGAAALVSSGSAAEPVPLSLLMAWPAGLVTTAVQQQPMLLPAPVCAAPAQAAAAAAPAAGSRRRSTGPTSSCSSAGDDSSERCNNATNPASTSSGDSDGPAATANPANGVDTKLTRMQAAAAKRKAPEVDWRAITDPAERRKQRRLAKNRVTAARSRERKKAAWGEMEGTMSQLEGENAQLRAAMEAMAKENARLQAALASLYRGAGAVCGGVGVGSSATEPAALVCLAIMHLVRLLPTRAERVFFLLLMCLVSAAAAVTVAFAAASGLLGAFASSAFVGSASFARMTAGASWLQPAFAVHARTRRRQSELVVPVALQSGHCDGHPPCVARKAVGSRKHTGPFLGSTLIGGMNSLVSMSWQQVGSCHAAAQAA